MKNVKILFAFLLIFCHNIINAQNKWYVTVTMPPTLTTEGYDALFAKLGAQGLANCFSEYHAAGPNPKGGYFGFTTFSSKAQADARLSVFKPYLSNGIVPVDYEVHNVIGNPNSTASTSNSIIAFFDAKGFTEGQYAKILEELNKVSEGANPARLYHVAYKTNDGLKVIDVWKDAESFGAFGQKLMPIMQAAGTSPTQPMVIPLHAIRKPSMADKNTDAALTAYAAFSRGDIPSVINMLSDDCDWSHAGNAAVIPFAGSFSGKAGVGRFFEQVGKNLQITKFEPGSFRATENSVTCTVDIAGSVTSTGKPYANKLEQTFWFDAMGKIKKWTAVGDVSALEAAFGK